MILAVLMGCSNKEFVPNYDESAVPDYKLPELLVTKEGAKINNFTEWRNIRKNKILQDFESEMYGKYPDLEYNIEFKERILSDNYLNGKAISKEINVEVETINGRGSFSILYFFPQNLKQVPVFVGLNFYGNHTIDTLNSISIHNAWVKNNKSKNISDNLANENSRGIRTRRWPLERLIDNGYGLATVYYGEFDPDFDDGFENGFHPIFATPGEERDIHSAGSISMWAKGMSLIADYLQHDSIADPTRIIAIGHSRMGKTALWAGANDERFAAVISNNSGCGGAALSRRQFGETVGRINTSFPHWFCERFKRYNQKEHKLPFDQHMLLALIAPRPVYVASATKDRWADPKGEYLALKAALPVYKLSSGYETSFPEELPVPDKPILNKTGYHLRTGPHNITDYDWLTFINWSNKWLGGSN